MLVVDDKIGGICCQFNCIWISSEIDQYPSGIELAFYGLYTAFTLTCRWPRLPGFSNARKRERAIVYIPDLYSCSGVK